jgi:hypothetical protein
MGCKADGHRGVGDGERAGDGHPDARAVAP